MSRALRWSAGTLNKRKIEDAQSRRHARISRAKHHAAAAAAGVSDMLCLAILFFFAHLRPQALHSVFGPCGPRLRIHVSDRLDMMERRALTAIQVNLYFHNHDIRNHLLLYVASWASFSCHRLRLLPHWQALCRSLLLCLQRFDRVSPQRQSPARHKYLLSRGSWCCLTRGLRVYLLLPSCVIERRSAPR